MVKEYNHLQWMGQAGEETAFSPSDSMGHLTALGC
jgi:hypothetical protein